MDLMSVSPNSLLINKHFIRFSSSHGELHGKFAPLRTNYPLFLPSRSLGKNQIPHSILPDQSKKSPFNLSERWKEIQGEKLWEGLLEHPIDATLRAEIIRYGEFAQVCYDAFDFNEHSLYCGSCKYNRRALFEKVDKGKCGYEVTKYLYATSKLNFPKFFRKSEREEEKRWSCDSNWIGYIAVCTDDAELRRIGRRDIVIAWRGTVTKTEWAEDLMAMQAPANIGQKDVANVKVDDGANTSAPSAHTQAVRGPQSARNEEDSSGIVKVESGFLSLYSSSKANSRFNKLSAGQQMAMEVKRLLQKYEGEEVSITITGHSLGAALALLSAYDIAANVAPSLNLAVAAAELAVPRDSSSRPSVASSDPTSRAAGSNTRVSALAPTSTDVAPSLNLAASAPSIMASFSNPKVAAPTLNSATLAAAAGMENCSRPSVAASAPPNIAAGSNVPKGDAVPKPTSTNMAAAAPRETAEAAPNLVITVLAFGGPRVGNKAWKRRVEQMGVRVLRVVNVHDCVPKVPGLLFRESASCGYHHVGKELLIDLDYSPHLRHTRDLPCHHNLEAYLHILDGFHGFKYPFQSVFGRSPVLVNKSSDFLIKDAHIPPSWWQESNKGLVKDPSSGQWVLASREDDHLPESHVDSPYA